MARETIASVKAAAAQREKSLARQLAVVRSDKETWADSYRKVNESFYSELARVGRRNERVRELENERKRLSRALDKATRQQKPKPGDLEVQLITEAQQHFDRPVVEAFCDIVTDPSMRDITMGLVERGGMSLLEMLLTGAGMNVQARRHLNRRLDEVWAASKATSFSASDYQPVIVGSGVHAAIYAAVWHKKTGVKPLVLEKNRRAGGSFAVTEGPAFYLNSRNRPGPLSVPGDEFGALNVLPAAPVQPAQLGGGEYLSNDQIAWTVRMCLLMHARVMPETEVTDIKYSGGRYGYMYLNNKTSNYSYVYRCVVATGLTGPRKAFQIDSPRYLRFDQFMARMDDMFPLQGMRRVAVIGAGDGGKTVIEALTGQGPAPGYSVPSLDFVEKIDWYGVPEDRRTRTTWETCNRSRYKGIGRLLPQDTSPYRVLPFPNPTYCDVGYDSVKLDGMPYDYVIDCTGYTMEDPISNLVGDWVTVTDNSGQQLGKGFGGARRFTVAGPQAKLASERADEQTLNGIAENTTSIFRYADRTARLAELSVT